MILTRCASPLRPPGIAVPRLEKWYPSFHVGPRLTFYSRLSQATGGPYSGVVDAAGRTLHA
jgi:hypothetical protein